MPKFFVAILPPPLILEEIVGFQKEIEKHFGAIHAQKAPPHVTVIPPFDCNEEKIERFMITLTSYLTKYNSQITVKLDNFQRFDSRTLFVDVAKNEQFEHFCKSLKQLFNQQKLIKQREEKHFFVPHITIANKDIHKKDFKKAWALFSPLIYQRSFSLSSISVLELVERKWHVKKEITFESCT